MRRVRRASANAWGMRSSEALVSTMSAARWASAAPSAMASETSAPASTGASLIPSPTIATTSPRACNSRIRASLASGVCRHDASTMPSSAASEDTAAAASPLHSSTAQAWRRSWPSASSASGRVSSRRLKLAAQWRPSPNQSRSSSRPSPANAARPIRQSRSSTCPSIPEPATWRSRDTTKPVSCSRKALAMGCVLSRSSAAATCSKCLGFSTWHRDRSAMLRPGRVSVPVLSKTTRSTRAKVARASGETTSTPMAARRPCAAVSAAGMASDKAQGQLTTSTASVTSKARDGSCACHQA